MISEFYGMRLSCDTKNCITSTTVHEISHEACNMRLYLIGWRLNGRTGKHICPHCMIKHNKRSAK